MPSSELDPHPNPPPFRGREQAGASHDAREQITRAWTAAESVADPEIPVLSIADLGVLRDIQIVDGFIEATITPTYSGCPAMNLIALNLELALEEAGFHMPRVKTVLSPAWTTDWMTDAGKAKLRKYGIAPPAGKASRRALFGEDEVSCPHCGSANTERISEFGSTACKALWRCKACAEPFDYFKCI
jgi:ring-1,2-phenylacetyl-CoA epoxidase subunit PaaD